MGSMDAVPIYLIHGTVLGTILLNAKTSCMYIGTTAELRDSSALYSKCRDALYQIC